MPRKDSMILLLLLLDVSRPFFTVISSICILLKVGHGWINTGYGCSGDCGNVGTDVHGYVVVKIVVGSLW